MPKNAEDSAKNAKDTFSVGIDSVDVEVLWVEGTRKSWNEQSSLNSQLYLIRRQTADTPQRQTLPSCDPHLIETLRFQPIYPLLASY
jgi:hypothetical protein